MSKREILVKGTDLKNSKKKRFKKLLCWLVIDISVAFIIFALLLYKPGQYNPVITETNEISSALTRLSSDIYNNTQLGKPFEITITQEVLNEIINQADWPKESEGVLLYAPAALINPDVIVLMGTADFQGMEFIITIELQAKLNEQGLMNINVPKIKVGAINVTPLARITAKKMYTERLNQIQDINSYTWQTKIVASLLNEEAIEPVFDMEDYNIHVEKITIEQGKIITNLVPTRKIR